MSSSAKSRPASTSASRLSRSSRSSCSGRAMPPASCLRACFSSRAIRASITAWTASARVRSSLPARKARRVNSPGWARGSRPGAAARSAAPAGAGGERVHFGQILAGVAVRRRPEVQVGRQRSEIRQTHMSRPQGTLTGDDELRLGEQRRDHIGGGAGPLTRTMAPAPGPEAEDRAVMVSCVCIRKGEPLHPAAVEAI